MRISISNPLQNIRRAKHRNQRHHSTLRTKFPHERNHMKYQHKALKWITKSRSRSALLFRI